MGRFQDYIRFYDPEQFRAMITEICRDVQKADHALVLKGRQEVDAELLQSSAKMLKQMAVLKDATAKISSRLKESHSAEGVDSSRLSDLNDNQTFTEAARKVIMSHRTLLNKARLFTIWQAVRNTSRLDGAIAEVGVYKGGGSAFIAEAVRQIAKSSSPRIYSVDTFEGHATVSDKDNFHKLGMFADTNYEDVSSYLSAYPEITVIKAAFSPQVPEFQAEKTLKFVHLDMDVYGPTLEALRFFWPKLPVGGVIIVDDFDSNKCAGIRAAVEEFINAVEVKVSTWLPRSYQAVLIKLGE